MPTAKRSRFTAALPPAMLVLAVAAALTSASRLVFYQTVAVVSARRLMPRSDAASHLLAGWTDYHFLVTGQVHRLLADLWTQGYWPPMHSIYQMPFFLVLGPGMASGLTSSLAAFVLIGSLGAVLLWMQWRWAALLPAAVFGALLMTSPYVLAYASVTMTEIVGALAQMIVLVCYLRCRQKPAPRNARLFAISLTVLFFTKYNYFLLLAAPLALHAWLERTSEQSAGHRIGGLFRAAGRGLLNPTIACLAVYVLGVFAIVLSGGVEFHVVGQRVSVHSIGNSGHLVLYALVARVVYLYRRGRLRIPDVQREPLVWPLLVWLVVPVAIWFASPYPNHIKDFFNLVINRPMGDVTVGSSAAVYFETVRHLYFFNDWVLGAVIAAFAIAAIGYQRQPPLMQWLILAVPIQFGAIALHQTRFPRFMLLTVVLFCLAASGELARWLRQKGVRIAAGVAAPAVLAIGVAGTHHVVTQGRFVAAAAEHFSDSSALRSALDAVRRELRPTERLAVIGGSNDVSFALLRWELGPPSGAACFPFELSGARGQSLDTASLALLLVPIRSDRTLFDLTDDYGAGRQEIEARAGRHEFRLRHEIPVDDMSVVFQIYDRPSAPTRLARCY